MKRSEYPMGLEKRKGLADDVVRSSMERAHTQIRSARESIARSDTEKRLQDIAW
jgi:hypothetical protein